MFVFPFSFSVFLRVAHLSSQLRKKGNPIVLNNTSFLQIFDMTLRDLLAIQRKRSNHKITSKQQSCLALDTIKLEALPRIRVLVGIGIRKVLSSKVLQEK